MSGALLASAALHVVLFELPIGASGPSSVAARTDGAEVPITATLAAAALALPLDADEPETRPPPVPRIAQPSRVARASPPPMREEATVERAPPEAPDLTYYPARQLDTFPALTLGLTASTGAARGDVLLLVLIDAEGRVDAVSVVEAEPAGVLEDEARRAVLAARFTPARKDGRAVRSRLLLHLTYGSRD